MSEFQIFDHLNNKVDLKSKGSNLQETLNDTYPTNGAIDNVIEGSIPPIHFPQHASE